MAHDRGTVSKVDLEIEYPDGRVKKVTLSNNPSDNVHNHYMINELSGLLFSHTGSQPDLKDFEAAFNDDKKMQAWQVIGEGDDFKPALVVLKTDGDVHIMCGGHKNGHVRIAAE